MHNIKHLLDAFFPQKLQLIQDILGEIFRFALQCVHDQTRI